MKSRRTVLKTMAAAVPALANAQEHQHESPLVQITGAYKWKLFTADEVTRVSALVDTIIPRTGTPGASEAGVPQFIDRRLAANPDLARRFRAGLALLGADFAALSGQARIDKLTSIIDDPFFRLAKSLTVDGYYTSEAGLKQELGWHGNTYLAEFEGCTHPEHQS